VVGVLLAVCSLSAQTQPNIAPKPVLPPSLTAPQPPASQEQPKADSIDELLNKLDLIEAQEAKLRKVKEETVAKLKEKLKQLKQQLQKHRINGEDETPAAAVPTIGSTPPVPSSVIPPLPETTGQP